MFYQILYNPLKCLPITYPLIRPPLPILQNRLRGSLHSLQLLHVLLQFFIRHPTESLICRRAKIPRGYQI